MLQNCLEDGVLWLVCTIVPTCYPSYPERLNDPSRKSSHLTELVCGGQVCRACLVDKIDLKYLKWKFIYSDKKGLKR